VNGVGRNHIARLNGDGTLDTDFLDGLPGVAFVNSVTYVSSIAVQTDDKVLIAGSFSTVNGASRNGIARLNADGTLDGEFLNGLSAAELPYDLPEGRLGPYVASVVVQGDGKVQIGGSFTTFNGASRNAMA